MTDNQKNPKENLNIAPDVSNDQLGENASMEFAQEYDNKGSSQKNQKKPDKSE